VTGSRSPVRLCVGAGGGGARDAALAPLPGGGGGQPGVGARHPQGALPRAVVRAQAEAAAGGSVLSMLPPRHPRNDHLRLRAAHAPAVRDQLLRPRRTFDTGPASWRSWRTRPWHPLTTPTCTRSSSRTCSSTSRVRVAAAPQPFCMHATRPPRRHAHPGHPGCAAASRRLRPAEPHRRLLVVSVC
jgi:hypothetical protein